MKKIYALVLDEEIPSDKLKNDLRLITYFVYNELINITNEESCFRDMLINSENIKYNALLENGISSEKDKETYAYYFITDLKQINESTYYDPFVINEYSCGLTIDESILNTDINKVIDEEITFLFKNNLITKKYKYTVITSEYDHDKDRTRCIKKIKLLVDKHLLISNKTNKTNNKTLVRTIPKIIMQFCGR